MPRATRIYRGTFLALAAGSLAACSLAPTYQQPQVAAPAQYQDTGPWTGAQPADRLPRGGWWQIYGDAQLSTLETQLDANNPDLAAALASYDQARAYDAQVSAGELPMVSGGASVDRDRQSNTRPLRGANEPDEYNADTVDLQAAWDLDLWGKIRNQVAAARAATQAAAEDLASARLSLEVRLADDYVGLCGTDRELKVLADAVDSYQKALAMTQILHQGGVVSGLDVSRAQTLLDTTKAQVSELRGQRALLEHAIATLTGQSAPAFSLPPLLDPMSLPQIPVGVPSTLLQRRPDVAAAERRTAAANASIGVARAAFFPDFSLQAVIGLQSSDNSAWLTAPSAFWALGPNVAQYIFDGGLRRAQLDQAKAVLSQAGAHYRSVALEAFRQVQDQLALLDNYQAETADQDAAVVAAQHTLDLSLEQYRDGAVDYLNVVDSQVAALSAQRAQLQLQTRQLQASVNLVQAIGGGWDASAPVQAAPVKLSRSSE
jgi:NodT family efflux transporter outer membrane factor (OMF) lipoprotein